MPLSPGALRHVRGRFGCGPPRKYSCARDFSQMASHPTCDQSQGARKLGIVGFAARRLGAVAFLLFPLGGAATAQERPSPAIEVEAGWMGFADDGIVSESLAGGSWSPSTITEPTGASPVAMACRASSMQRRMCRSCCDRLLIGSRCPNASLIARGADPPIR
jgi:hypothetical protein